MNKTNRMILIITVYAIFIILLIVEMFSINVPINRSFQAKAERCDDVYKIKTADIGDAVQDEGVLYIRENNNEKVIKVRYTIKNNFLVFETKDYYFLKNFHKIHTYEITMGSTSLLKCVFLKGGKTNE